MNFICRKKNNLRIGLIFLFAVILLANNNLLANNLISQNQTLKPNNKNKNIKRNPPKNQKFPDNYSPLDNSKTMRVITNELIENTIETARQDYIKGLITLQKEDTLAAVGFFETALTKLNKLASYPEVENNKDFKELSLNILTDYENCTKNSNLVSDNIILPKENLFGSNVPINEVAKEDEIPKEEYQSLPNADLNEQYIFALPPIDDLTIPMAENEAIDFHIKFFTKGAGSKYLPVWMERSSRWFPMMEEIAENEGMPKEILLLTFVESGLNPIVPSKAGALGLWQFMPKTGVDYGLNRRQSIWIDERRDPIKSTRAGLRYLRDLYLEFNDWHLALAAYNWGWGNVERSLKKINKDKPSFWDIKNQKNIKMPKETQNYVPCYLALLKIMSNPAEYGIDVSKLNYMPEFKYDVIELEQATNLEAVSKAIGVGIEEIRELNTELLFDITPPDRKYYSLRVPVGTAKDFQANFAKLPLEERQPSLNHKVTKGENIISVSEKYDVSIDELLALNKISANYIELTFNTDLKIPIGGKNYAQSTLTYSKNQLVNKSELLATDTNFHIVRAEETVYSIAEKYSISAANLRNWNDLEIEQDSIEEGKTLIISAEEAAKQKKNPKGEIINTNLVNNQNTKAEKNNSKAKNTNSKAENSQETTSHKIKKGETISEIAKKYNMSENALKELNSDKIKGDKIFVGDILNVNENSKANEKVKPKNENKNKAKYHKVTSGDNLYNLAKKYKTSVNSIIKLNRNINPDILSLGQRIRIK
jgi:membrane-bound lytic murein transglycosylase D